MKAEAAAGTLEGALVLDVNRPLRVVALDVGAEQGVRLGMPFLVWRDNRLAAELRVIEVRPRVCAAWIEREEKRIQLRAGDVAQVTRSTDGLLR
jgi:hypothetical protein